MDETIQSCKMPTVAVRLVVACYKLDKARRIIDLFFFSFLNFLSKFPFTNHLLPQCLVAQFTCVSLSVVNGIQVI